jgi:pyruvate/2-oxoglutarate/acetoin dehydrogenase E1 component
MSTPNNSEQVINFSEAINDAMIQAMEADNKVFCYGLGVDDPKRIFGSTNELKERFGSSRVFDVPASENALMGIGVGAALGGYRPIFVNQRFDFILLAMDQIVNAAAKWRYMFGGKNKVPMVLRVVVGRGWGQGPTHSQCLHSWLAHIPGLKVVMPTSPRDAKGLLLSSIFDDNPVIFIEHRWLHNTSGPVPTGDFRIPLGKSKLLREGTDLTIVAISYMNIEAVHALDHLNQQGISADLIDLRCIRPIDWEKISLSVKKTGRLLVLDIGAGAVSVASEIVSKVSTDNWSDLKTAPIKICMPDNAQPTSPALTKGFYPDASSIVRGISSLVGKELEWESLTNMQSWPHDVPGTWFKGPF